MDDLRSAPAVRVLYVAGAGRSGSTVISNILGQVPGCFAAGELRYLWQRGIELDQRCGCGLRFSECPVWMAVVVKLHARTTDLDAQGIGRRLLQRLRILRLPTVMVRRAAGRPPVPAHRDDENITALYRAISDQTGGSVVVDSSKLPPYGLLLEGLPGVELTVLQVVRDPRATAFSWLRQKENDGRPMQRQQAWKSSSLWLLWNLIAAGAWRSSAPRVLRVRYEDFVREPQAIMSEVVASLGLDPKGLPFKDDETVTLAPTHSVAGNPNRHETGAVTLRSDDEWRRSMPTSQRTVVTLVTLPGLLRFGYPVRPARPVQLTRRGASQST